MGTLQLTAILPLLSKCNFKASSRSVIVIQFTSKAPLLVYTILYMKCHDIASKILVNVLKFSFFLPIVMNVAVNDLL